MTVALSIPNDQQPFASDAFSNRLAFASHLESVLERMTPIAVPVVAIDAAWGQGKSWFALEWQKRLDQVSNHETVYINAFEHDYLEEPFAVIAAKVGAKIAPKSQSFVENAAKVGKALLPFASRAALIAVSCFIPGAIDELEKFKDSIEDFGSKLGESVETNIAEHIRNIQGETDHILAFKASLGEALAGRKMTVIVDELDRCNPAFAIKLLDRLKHLFGHQGLRFVIFVNRVQLETSIVHAFGEGTDGGVWLLKFIDLWLNLPGASDGMMPKTRELRFAMNTLEKFGMRSGEIGLVADDLIIWADVFDLSLRDQERIAIQLGLVGAGVQAYRLLVYLAVLKIIKPTQFDGLAKSLRADHKSALEVLQQVRDKLERKNTPRPGQLMAMIGYHEAILGEDASAENKSAAVEAIQNLDAHEGTRVILKHLIGA